MFNNRARKGYTPPPTGLNRKKRKAAETRQPHAGAYSEATVGRGMPVKVKKPPRRGQKPPK